MADVVAFIAAHRTSEDPFDVSVTAMSSTDEGHAQFDIGAFEETGATWWFEQWHREVSAHDAWLERVRAGPLTA